MNLRGNGQQGVAISFDTAISNIVINATVNGVGTAPTDAGSSIFQFLTVTATDSLTANGSFRFDNRDFSFTVSKPAGDGVNNGFTLAATRVVGPPVASLSVVSGNNQSVAAGTQELPNPIVVVARDAGGLTVPGADITGNINGSVSTILTDANGQASFPVQSIPNLAGTYPATFTNPAVAAPLGANFTVTAGDPRFVLTQSGGAQSTQVSTAFANPIVIEVQDQFNNRVPNITVTLTPPAAGASATLSQTNPVTDANGRVSITATANTIAGANYRVGIEVRNSLGTFTVTSDFVLTNTAAPDLTPPTLAISGVPAGSAAPFTATFTFSEAVNNFDVTDITVTNGAASAFTGINGDSVFTALITPAANGLVTIDIAAGVAADLAGNATAAPSQAQSTFTSPPSAITIVSGSGQNVAISTAFAAPLLVRVTDAGGNPVQNANVTFTAPTSGASGSFAGGGTVETVQTNAGGIATSSAFTANSTAGAYTVTASSPGLANAAFTLSNAAGPAAALSILSGSPQTTRTNTRFESALTVLVTDAGGNALSGIAVTYGAPTGDATATLSATATATNAAGQASILATANGTGGVYTIVASVTGLTSVSFALTNVAGPSIEQTQAAIADFMLNRANHLLTNQPDVSGFLDGSNIQGGGALGSLNMDATRHGVVMSFATSRQHIVKAAGDTSAQPIKAALQAASLQMPDGGGTARHPGFHRPQRDPLQDLTAEQGQLSAASAADEPLDTAADAPAPGRSGTWDMWLQVNGATAETGASDTTTWVGYAGAHIFVEDTLLIGAMAQLDWSEETNSSANSKATGLGWMVGPYLAGSVPEHSLTYAANVAYGRSDNRISPDRTYTDDFTTDRWLMSGSLAGTYALDDTLRVRPEVSLSWFRENQHSYTDSLARTIPSQHISLGIAQFGPEFIKDVTLENGGFVQTSVGVSGVFNFDVSADNATQGFPISEDDLRARFDLGIQGRDIVEGVSVGIDTHYDGVGTPDFASWGGGLRVVISLN